MSNDLSSVHLLPVHQNSWRSWCRLCAKQNKSGEENGAIFGKEADASNLATSIGKFFWVNIKEEDKISKDICKECQKLIGELTIFTERVNKVQTLYCLLQNLNPASLAEANKLRSQCGLIDEGWEHIIKDENINLKKPDTLNQEVQTDLVIFFNSGLGTNNEKNKVGISKNGKGEIKRKDVHQNIKQTIEYVEKETEYNNYSISRNNYIESIKGEEIMMDIETGAQQTIEYLENDSEYKNISADVTRSKIESASYDKTLEESPKHDIVQSFEYILEESDDEMEEMDANSSVEQEDNTKFRSEPEGVEAEEEGELLEELKFKYEGIEEGKLTNDEEIEEFQLLKVDKTSVEDLDEDYIEIFDDDDDDVEQQYVDIINTNDKDAPNADALALLQQRKRGRPSVSSQPDEKALLSLYRYECKACRRKYKNPTVYRKHMLSAHEVAAEDLPNNICTVCQKDCFTPSRLSIHIRQHLPDEQKLLVPCPFCDRKFSQVGVMRQHVNGIHHQKKPYICDQCGKGCKTLAALNEHKLVHTDECPYECNVCNKKFKNKARLKSHMDIHTESDYPCPDCGLRLNTKRTLLQHRLVHTDEKRFKCEFCDAAFKRSKALKNHLILHSGLKPYKCQFCDKSFSNGSNCRSHKRKLHPQELAEEELQGKKYVPASVPKLEELKAAKRMLAQPRKVNRQNPGLPYHVRKMIMAAEQEEQREEQAQLVNPEDSNDASTPQHAMQDAHYEIEEEIADESMEDGDDCEETVIYEIIDEI